MENLFKEADAEKFIERYPNHPEELAVRVYTSRLIGSERSLVLHGGGNTSVKCRQKNILGEESDVIYIKGSGWDLSTIGPDGFVGLQLDPIRKLRHLDSLSDIEMENELAIHRIHARTPNPSIEALLHAFLPHRFVDHTHSDAILVLTNQKNGHKLIEDVLGADVAVLPYAMSGFPLAKSVWQAYEANPDITALVILHHGIFTFGETAKAAYEEMIACVSLAEEYIQSIVEEKSSARPLTTSRPPEDSASYLTKVVPMIRGICARPLSKEKHQRYIAEIRTAPDLVETSLSDDAEAICLSGVLTPDHVIRTKHRMAFINEVPETDEDLKAAVSKALERFQSDYQHYCESNIGAKDMDAASFDPYPLLFFVSGIGLVALGKTPKAANIAADIGEQTIRAKKRSFAIGEYVPISDSHAFDMEFWNLQQRKLEPASARPLQGQIAMITGGAGAIGFGIAERLLAAGAVVVITDIDEKRIEKVGSVLADAYDTSYVTTMHMDVTDIQSVEGAYRKVIKKYGGIDIVVPNAGIAHVARIEALDPENLDRVLAVNLKGTFTVIKAAIPVFKRQGTGGNIVLISSKNVFDPGAAFSAYSASKAGAHQIAKIAAMELAELGVRVNMINPDAVFGDEEISSKLWDEIGPDRMKSRGLDAAGLRDYYRQRSLLKVSVLGEHVGNAVVFFASELTPTTGASLPVDAGNSAAFPR